MALKFKDYGVVGTTEYMRTWCSISSKSRWISMVSPPPVEGAMANADGTWSAPVYPDLTMGEAEALVRMFPVSYEYVFNMLGIDV